MPSGTRLAAEKALNRPRFGGGHEGSILIISRAYSPVVGNDMTSSFARFVVALYCALALQPAAFAQQRYEIDWEIDTTDEVEVSARIAAPTGQLRFADGGVPGHERGWADRVTGIEARSVDGTILTLTSTQDGWSIAEAQEWIDLRYRVDLSYLWADNWPGGPRTVGGMRDDGEALLLSSPFFIVDEGWDGSAEVQFSEGIAGTVVPWEPMGARRYRARDKASLTDNFIALGILQPQSIGVGAFDIEIAAVGFPPEQSAALAESVETSLAHFQDLLGPPDPTRYLVAYFPAPYWQTGEAKPQSFAVSSIVPLDRRAKPAWANTVAHELLHYWNGHRVKMKVWEDGQWFSEGVTEYLSNVALIRTGQIELQEFLNLMQNHAMLYHRFRYGYGTKYERISLLEAGAQKSEYNAAIYEGGAIAAFCLDVGMREAGGNEKGMDRFLAHLASREGEELVYDNDELLAEIERFSGYDARSFFEGHVAGRATIDSKSCFDRAGFDALSNLLNAQIFIDENAVGDRLAIRRALIGH